jgi:hypothetical protein
LVLREKNMSKQEQMNEFMSDLESYVERVAKDAVGRQHDSCEIHHIPKAKEKMKNSLKTLLDIG